MSVHENMAQFGGKGAVNVSAMIADAATKVPAGSEGGSAAAAQSKAERQVSLG